MTVAAPVSGSIVDEPPLRKLYRSSEGRLLGGVARGLAGHMGLPVVWVRLGFCALLLAKGLGVLLYAVFWFVVPLGTGGVSAPFRAATRSAGRRRGFRLRFARGPDTAQIVTVLVVVVALGVLNDTLQFGAANTYLWPLILIGLGVAVVWRQADNSRRAHWVEVTRSNKRLLFVARSMAGVVLVGAGISGIVVIQGSTSQFGAVLQASLAVIVGAALLAGPYLVRMAQDLSEERLMRIRAQERAEVAAHVHDSVLHTLTLIQRSADDPREVARLARSQERDLRVWLHRPEPAGRQESEEPRTVADAIRATVAEVEDHHGVPVDVVCVSDCLLDEGLVAQVQAAREAVVNAAKYGGEDGPVQVFAEVEERRVFVSVRDRGPGFDLEAVPEDRMGVRESIIGRMRRHGGTARLRSAPDGGTVVELEMEREAR